ncbi:MAG: FmdB family zinc ribbon protein [Steroidobacteraceae bacterium]
MPFYEYECSSCRFYSEIMQKISDAPLRKCPSCGRNTFRKLISAPFFRLKGSGWYETDFKSDKEQKRNLIDRDTEPATSEAKSSDTKDAASKDKADAGAAKKESPPPAKPEAAKARPSRSRGKAASPPRRAAAKKSRPAGRAKRSKARR